jgi:hypothetical protein
MKYILLIYGEEKAWTDEYREACYAESGRLVEGLKASRQFIAASPLQPTETATSVRVRDGKTVVTDGPFAETREQLGGFYLIDAPDLDAAVAIAARVPPARTGTVEIRPVVELTPDATPE